MKAGMEMTNQNRRIYLSDEERQFLEDHTRKGKSSARSIRRAQMLLLSDENRAGGRKTIAEIIELLGCSSNTLYTVKKTYHEEGMEAALSRKKRLTPPVESKITGEVEAKIIALSCSTPPEGAARWSLRLLRDKVIELEILDEVSHVTIHELLKKTKSNRT